MTTPLAPVRSRMPGGDGYRTPTIEDDNHPANINILRQTVNVTPLETLHRSMRTRLTAFQKLQNEAPGATGRRKDEHKHLSWRQRMRHVTWAYFTLTMATGGIANVLHSVPFQFPGLTAIGLIFFFLNLVLYLLIWVMILTRFISYPYTFRSSFTHPTESLFVPAFAVSFGTILITIVEYGSNNAGPWLTRAVLVLFWFDAALAVVLSIAIYLILWSSTSFTIAKMTPIWIFPAYPLLIIGPHAANLAARLPSTKNAIQVIVGGFTIQGIGFLVSITIYSAFVYRLMTQKLPAEPLRPGMFVSVGPSAFTVSGTIGMAADLKRAIASEPGNMFMDIDAELAANILRLVANWMGLWLWGLALWFFFVSLVSNIAPLYVHADHKIPFSMTWYSFIFPQTALCTATFRIAEAFNLHSLKIVGCVMTCLLVALWMFVVAAMIKAIVRKEILWPEKGEDKEEGGFKHARGQEDESAAANGDSSSIRRDSSIRRKLDLENGFASLEASRAIAHDGEHVVEDGNRYRSDRTMEEEKVNI